MSSGTAAYSSKSILLIHVKEARKTKQRISKKQIKSGCGTLPRVYTAW